MCLEWEDGVSLGSSEESVCVSVCLSVEDGVSLGSGEERVCVSQCGGWREPGHQ